MKSILLRFGFFLPAAVFAVFVLMIIVGCLANVLGADATFYCGAYCKLGILLLVFIGGGVVFSGFKNAR